jgi:hypothetical protein
VVKKIPEAEEEMVGTMITQTSVHGKIGVHGLVLLEVYYSYTYYINKLGDAHVKYATTRSPQPGLFLRGLLPM